MRTVKYRLPSESSIGRRGWLGEGQQILVKLKTEEKQKKKTTSFIKQHKYNNEKLSTITSKKSGNSLGTG